MGVYATVHICIARVEPLSIDTRVAIVELAIEHQLITKQCAVSAPRPAPIRGVWDALKAAVGARPMWDTTIEDGEPGPWIAERMRTTPPTFSVSSPFPVWKGEELTGPFVYTCYRRPKTVEMFDAYRSREDRSPYAPNDDVIGTFFDVIEVEAKRDYDAKIAAGSKFVRQLKALTGAKVICRTSWA